MKRFIKETYSNLFKKISETNFEINFSERDDKTIDNFIELLPSYVDKDWMFDFMIFGFSRYANLETKYGKGRVQLNWVIGKKALTSYTNKTEQQIFYTNKLKLDKGILKKKKYKTFLSDEYKDNERRRFLNTERGFYHCKENLLNYQTNKICIKCNFKKECQC